VGSLSPLGEQGAREGGRQNLSWFSIIKPFGVVFLLLSLTLGNSQNLSGIVVDPCTGSRKIANAKIQIQLLSDQLQSWIATTNSNGQWSFTFSSEQPDGAYSVSVVSPSDADPVQYTVNKPGADNMSLDFVAFPDVAPITIQNCIDGSMVNVPEEGPAFLVNCEGKEDNFPFWAITIEAVESGIVSPTGHCDLIPLAPFCVNIRVWDADRDGNITGVIPDYEEIFNSMDCRELCLGFAGRIGIFLSQANLVSGYYIIEFEINCCAERGPKKSIQQHVLLYEDGISTADAEFTYIASQLVEQINNEPQPYDGQIARSSVKPGPELGDLSIGLNIALPEESFITAYSVSVYEVGCTGDDDEVLIYSTGETSAPYGQYSYPFLFLTEILDQATGWPYFFVNSNTVGKCFKAKVSVENLCGSESAIGYFTITEQCQFCLLEDTPDQAAALPLPREKALAVAAPRVSVFPNPATDKTWFIAEATEEGPVQIDLFNAAGSWIARIVDEPATAKGRHGFEWARAGHLPPGIYFYRWSIGNAYGSGKLMLY
jgi:hypothetical protein